MKKWIVLLGACGLPLTCAAGMRQDLAGLQQLAQQFLLAQTTTLPGQVSVRVAAPDSRLQLAQCDAMQPYLAPGSRALGKTSVGIRCTAPLAWNIFLPATVSVTVTYIASAMPLAQGQRLAEADLVLKQGELSMLPAGVLTDMAQVRGRLLQIPVAAGMPLSRSLLRSVPSVQAGQPVRVVAHGSGFAISVDARALTSGAEGETVQARTASGQVIGGIAQADGTLAVQY